MAVKYKNKNENHFKVFYKGSPEKIKKLCKPETIPSKFTLDIIYQKVLDFKRLAIQIDFNKAKQ